MPVLDNPKYEMFAQQRAKGETYERAMKKVGFFAK
jgi:hypothetical protein